MKAIPLTQGKFAIVDDEDFERTNQFKWYFYGGYALRVAPNTAAKNTISMHRFILETPKDIITDHINHNGLDNRKENLRRATSQQSNRNRRKNSNSKSRYKGVTWDRSRRKWLAFIRINKKLTYLGGFLNEEDAAKKYNEVAKQNFGEFAYLNQFNKEEQK